MAVAIAVMTFWLGAFFVLLVEAAIFYIWFASKRVIKHQNLPEVKTKPPQVSAIVVYQFFHLMCSWFPQGETAEYNTHDYYYRWLKN